MSTSLRTLAVSALLTASLTAFADITRAADIGGEPLPSAKTIPRAASAAHWRGRDRSGRYYGWTARSGLIAGVRGANPLTVPFLGAGWYPGPVHYYGPLRGPCCSSGGEAIVSVRY